MTKINLLLLCIALIVPCSAWAQSSDTLFTVRQESLPPNDSGGRWLSSAIDLRSVSAYPQHVQIYTCYLTGGMEWEIADSGFYIADSIFLYGSTFVRSNTPWKFIDSTYTNSYAQLDFVVPAHGILRIPIRIRAFTQSGPPGDTASKLLGISAYSDSAGTHRYYGPNFNVRCIEMYSGFCPAWQESVPSTDSGGKWMPTALIFKSITGYPVRIYMSTFYFGEWAIADSGYDLADTILVTRGNRFDTSANPSHWRDSAYVEGTLEWALPPHQSIRIPLRVRALLDGISGPIPISDTISYTFIANTLWDSPGQGNVWYYDDINLRAVAGCVGPLTAYTGQPIDNQTHPAVIGGQHAFFSPTGPYVQDYEYTTVKYKLTGEYTDRFKLPTDSIITPTLGSATIEFDGAPKSPVYVTLTATFTDCWGTITTTTPITAYSTYPDGYQIRPFSPTLTAPFLGEAEGNAAVVINNSDFPITLRNLHPVGYDSMDFEVSAPAMIAGHDSAYITVILIDRDIYLDTLGTSRYADIAGIIAPYQQELGFTDSTFSVSVSGKINVYCPLYYSLIPEIRHGVHPAGILFTSSVSSMAGPGTFLTVYGNNDSTTEYFGTPYYDDPHFQLAVGNYTGLSSTTLPGYLRPDTGFPPQTIEALTTFTGDSYHNYYTQLHWPRAIDTVTIDVLAIGPDAPTYTPPLDDVKPVAPLPSSTISIWPNPASQLLHIYTPEQSPIWISDALGRIVLKKDLTAGYSDIDISNLPIGIYDLFLPEHRQAVKLQVFR